MREINIPLLRLYNQHISQPRFNKPEEIVQWMGAFQAQDYLGSLWAIALRLKNKNESDIEKAIKNKKIVRSWPMRGTLHFVAAEDLRWMLKFLTPRVIKRTAGLYKEAGLNNKVFVKSSNLFSAALKNGQPLTRNELYTILERAGITPGMQRGLHIIGHLAQEGLICFGPRKDKQQTFVLLDDWLPSFQIPTREEALAKLATTYFRSHGPATINDFAWWSGLTLAETKIAIEMIGSKLVQEILNDQPYWMFPENKMSKSNHTVFLLPGYDEYLVAYKDRGAAFEPKFSKEIKSTGNGIFTSPIIVGGRIAGIWKRSFIKEKVVIETNMFAPMSQSILQVVDAEAQKVGKFLGMPVVVTHKRDKQ